MVGHGKFFFALQDKCHIVNGIGFTGALFAYGSQQGVES